MTAIHWKSDVSGPFGDAGGWSGGAVPGWSDDVILSASGTLPYTVTESGKHYVQSFRANPLATLSIINGTFTVRNGTGGGTNYGTVAVSDGAWLGVGGNFINQNGVHGSVLVNGAGAATGLIVAATGATFTRGRIVLSNEATNQIIGTLSGATGSQTVSTLTNAGVISGAGSIGANLAVINSGVIDATDSVALIVAPSNTTVAGNGTLVNTGTLEATGGGGLTLMGGKTLATDLSITNTGGVIQAVGAGSHVDLNGIALDGGTVKALNGGTINISAFGYYQFQYPTVSVGIVNQGAVNIYDVKLDVNGTISNSGSIGVRYADVELTGNTTLDNHGTVNLSSGGQFGSSIFSASASNTPTLTNVNNTIQGRGVIGVIFAGYGAYDGISLVNGANGVIDANITARFSSLDLVELNSTITNAGLIEASPGATLALGTSSYASGTVYNTGQILDNGGFLNVFDDVAGSGSIVVENGGTLEVYYRLHENVTFGDGTGELRLGFISEPFGGTLTGFSTTGGAEIRIDDLKFTNAGEATFSGTATSGVLSVSDGTKTITFTLLGDYLGTTFVTTSTGFAKGVIIKAMTPAIQTTTANPLPTLAASPHALIAAMASVGAPAAAAIRHADATAAHAPVLANPRAMIA